AAGPDALPSRGDLVRRTMRNRPARREAERLDAVVPDGYSGSQRRILMRTTFLCLAVLFLVPHVDAAPAPGEGRAAKEKLESLKKRLPDLLGAWLEKKENCTWLPGDWTCKPELRVLRRVGPERAKAVILLTAFDTKGGPMRNRDVLLTVFLLY